MWQLCCLAHVRLVMHYVLHARSTELWPAGRPACLQVRTGALATAEGISYLEAKHLLLLNYCMCIVFYLLLKAEGRPVREHPVIVRLVELRAYLEKIRPIDRKLQYQMDKMLLAAKSMQVSSTMCAQYHAELAPLQTACRHLHCQDRCPSAGSLVRADEVW